MTVESMGNERQPVMNDTTTLCGKTGQGGPLAEWVGTYEHRAIGPVWLESV